MSVPDDMVLQARQLEVRVGQRALLAGLDWNVRAGEFWCVLGRNGIGKSTLLHVAAGLQRPHAGEVLLCGQSLLEMSVPTMALHRGLLLQQQHDAFSLPVREAVQAGGFAQGRGWAQPADNDERVRAALEQVGLSSQAQQDLLQLSGGERQRVALATLLVQDPDLYLLDEPTSHQDIAAQLQIMQLLRGLAGRGKAVVASCHDINLAWRFATHVLLLGPDRPLAGTVNQVMVPPLLEAAFGCRFSLAALSRDGSSVFLSSL